MGSDICNCADGPWGNRQGGYDDGWREAMKFAHHAHTDENGRTSANGVLGSGPDCIIVDEDWLEGVLEDRDHYKKMWQDASESKVPPITEGQVEEAVQAAAEAMSYVTNGDPEIDIDYKKAWAAVRATLTVLGYAVPKEKKND